MYAQQGWHMPIAQQQPYGSILIAQQQHSYNHNANARVLMLERKVAQMEYEQLMEVELAEERHQRAEEARERAQKRRRYLASRFFP
jgi:hypothetical protein